MLHDVNDNDKDNFNEGRSDDSTEVNIRKKQLIQ